MKHQTNIFQAIKMALGSLRLQREHEGKDGKNEHLTKVKLCPSLRRENIWLPQAMIAVAL